MQKADNKKELNVLPVHLALLVVLVITSYLHRCLKTVMQMLKLLN